MTQGIFINGSRPKSKKQIKEYVDNLYVEGTDTTDPFGIVIERTSMFGNEFDGSLARAERLDNLGPFYFVGPDPRTSRKFYGTIEFNKKKERWVVK